MEGTERAGLIVALVSAERGWGGGEEQARLLAAGLRRRGHTCVVFACEKGPFAEHMAGEGFEVVSFPAKGRSPAAFWNLRRRLRRLQPDVLHANDSHALSAAGLAAVGLPIPARIASRRVVFPLRFSLQYRLLADRLVCVSHAVAEVCRQGGIPEPMLRVVYDGADPSRIAAGDRQRGRRSLEIADDQLLLLTVAKLTDCKGHTYLLDALPRVVKTFPQVVAVLAGDGELGGPLQAQVERLGLQQHVRLVGYRQDVPDLIQAADLFVLSSHTEGLCSTLIDAMLAGRPIVATTAGGIPEVLGKTSAESESTAWSVPPRDARALAEAILAALNSPEERALRQCRAQNRAKELFVADRMVEATLQVYRELAAGGGL